MGRKAALPGSGNSETKASKSENGENIAFSLAKHCFFRGKTYTFPRENMQSDVGKTCTLPRLSMHSPVGKGSRRAVFSSRLLDFKKERVSGKRVFLSFCNRIRLNPKQE